MTPLPVSEQRPRRGIAAAALLIMAGSLGSRVLGLVREQLTSGLFGAGNDIAAFTVADNVNTLLFDLIISGMLEAALIPVLALWALPHLRSEFRRISGALLVLVTLVLGSLSLLGLLFAPTVVRLMTSLGGAGNARGTETTALTIELTRIILPSIVFLGAAAVLMGSLYALERMTTPALSPGIRNLSVVVALIALSGALGVKSLPIGIVVGAVLIAAIQIPALRRADALPIPNVHFRHPAIRQILKLYLPISVGLIFSTAAVIIDRNLAWGAEENALGAMRYATTLVQLIMGLVGAAVSLAALPTLARHFNANDEAAFQETLMRALGLVTALIVPAVLGLAAIASPVVDLLFQHGKTTPAAAHLITIALLGYLPGHLFAAYDQVLIFSFYARQNTRTPVLVGVLATGVYFLAAFTLVGHLGMLGLVLANSAQFFVHALVMYWLARTTFGFRDERRFWQTAARCLLAAGIMALIALGVWFGSNRFLPAGSGLTATIREIALVLFPAGVGVGVYLLLAHLLRISEVTALINAVQGRLRFRSSPETGE